MPPQGLHIPVVAINQSVPNSMQRITLEQSLEQVHITRLFLNGMSTKNTPTTRGRHFN